MKKASPENSKPTTGRSDKLRMHGFTLGAVLLIASLLVASSVTAVINFILLAIPILTIAAVIGIFVVGIPMIYVGIQSRREALANAADHSPMLLSLEGFWKHSHAWEGGHPHFVGFQPIDHDIIIHLDSKSDDNSMTMREFMQMTSNGQKSHNKNVEKSLEGLSDYRRI